MNEGCSCKNVVPTPRPAGCPFDDDDADVIIQSSDSVHFKMYKVILGKASPIFKDIFCLPQSPPSERSPDDFFHGLPTVKVSEDSHTLLLLFTFCYPMEDPVLASIDDVRSVLEGAQKYQMDAIAKPFAVACRMGWEDDARVAARLTLGEAFWPLEPPLPVEFRYVSSENLLRLISYHRKCAAVACQLADDYPWANQLMNSLACQHCDKLYKGSTQATGLADWLRVFLSSAKSVLVTRPSSSAVTSGTFAWETMRKSYGCPPCDLPMHVVYKIHTVVELFGKELDSRIALVTLQLQL
ncbi:unnamed protein product [Somion occarium]|uniref:BTB domain-containing protein n=1 Tax=Somion occarium TaxID=3059160 RepID=A0ABP1DG04_9APHY